MYGGVCLRLGVSTFEQANPGHIAQAKVRSNKGLPFALRRKYEKLEQGSHVSAEWPKNNLLW